MNLAKRTLCGLLVAALSAAVMAATATPSEAQACKGRMSGQGSGLGPNSARTAAIEDWARKASARHGARFANSERARGIRYDCRSGLLEVKCVVTAVPCR